MRRAVGVTRTSVLIVLAAALGCRTHFAGRQDGGARTPSESLRAAVKIERGDVWIRLPTGLAFRQLTSVGVAREAALSPDERSVAYVVDTPGDSVEGGSGTVAATAIWLIQVDGSDARRLVRGHNGSDNHIGDFRTLRFSPDGKRLYFSSEAGAVTDAVHVVTTDSSQESLVCFGELQDVLSSGQYAGDLIVGQHKYLGERPGSYDMGGLFTPACQLIKELAVDSEGTGYDSVEAFYERFVPGRTPEQSAHD